MISLVALHARSLEEAFRNAFEMFDYDKKELLERSEFIRIFRLLNDLLENFGDRFLLPSQLEDLVNSVYTMNAKIDGVICYGDYLRTLAEHPIVQMSLCLQFQGSGRDKMRELMISSTEKLDTSDDNS
jgi:Ca2+-binding EF-hand superfamily protein